MTIPRHACSTCMLALAGAALTTTATASATPGSDRETEPVDTSERWATSSYVRYQPALGEVNRGAAGTSTPASRFGYGTRIWFAPDGWWALGLGVVDSTGGAGDVREPPSGFLDVDLALQLTPVDLLVPGGRLRLHAGVSGGATLGGDGFAFRPVAAPDSSSSDIEPTPMPDPPPAGTSTGAAPARYYEFAGVEAGYNVGAWLGASYWPLDWLGLYFDAGMTWHYAVFTRQVLNLAARGDEPRPPRSADLLWITQGMLNAGVSIRF